MLPKTRLAAGFDLQRGYIEAVVMAPSGPLRIYCMHLSHVGPAQRLPQVEALMEAVKGCERAGATWDGAGSDSFMFHETALAVPTSAIVAGDLNFTPRHPEYPRVAVSGLVDAWQSAGNSEEGVDSFPGECRIDHVFVTPDLAAKVTRSWIGHGTPASDHWPVFVEFA